MPGIRTTSFQYIFRQVRQFKFSISLMVIGGIFASIKSIVSNCLVGALFDYFSMPISQEVLNGIYQTIFIYLLLYLIDEVLYRFGYYLATVRMMPRMRANIVLDCINALTGRNYNTKDDRFSGEFAAKVKDISEELPNMITSFIDQGVMRIVTVISGVISLFVTNHWIFGVITLIWATSFIIVAYVANLHIALLSKQYAESSATISGNIVDILSNLLPIKLFTGRKYEMSKMRLNLDSTIEAEKRLQKAYSVFWTLHNLLTFFLQIAMFYFIYKGYTCGFIASGGIYVVTETINEIDEVMSLFCLDLGGFVRIYGKISQALNDIIMKYNAVADKPNAQDLVITKGEIVFDKVTFGYSTAKPILNNFSLHIAGGEKVGIVSESGAGKSTIINLLLRLFNISEGQILIDGQDISQVTHKSLLKGISFVPQETILFNRTIRENIIYGDRDATDEEVVKAAKHAKAHDFIMQLPMGYGTMVGERGSKLSGGQRQRITVARALLRSADILILDEPTSALDAVTEEAIKENLALLSKHRTTIVIAHRLSTLATMDRIIVIGEHGILGMGKHDELLKSCHLYQELQKAQDTSLKPGIG